MSSSRQYLVLNVFMIFLKIVFEIWKLSLVKSLWSSLSLSLLMFRRRLKMFLHKNIFFLFLFLFPFYVCLKVGWLVAARNIYYVKLPLFGFLFSSLFCCIFSFIFPFFLVYLFFSFLFFLLCWNLQRRRLQNLSTGRQKKEEKEFFFFFS